MARPLYIAVSAVIVGAGLLVEWTFLAWVFAVVAILVYFVIWPTRSMKAQRSTDAQERELRAAGPQMTERGLACPKCGGTQFKARRTAGDRTKIAAGTVTTGVGGVFSARKNQQKVQCVTCGTFYDRRA